MKRRDFIKITASASVGLGLCSGCGSGSEAAKFGGELRGEKHAVGHRMRDRSLQLPLLKPTEDLWDVVVLGGGMSGLTVAHKLRKEGFERVLVLEKEDLPGGMCRGQETQGMQYAIGAHYAEYPLPNQPLLCEIYEDCGVVQGYDAKGWPQVPEHFLVRGEASNLFVEGEWLPENFPFSVATEADIKEYERFEARCRELSEWKDKAGKRAFGLPLHNISDEAWVRQLDTLSMADWLAKEGFTSDLLRWFCNIWLVDEYGATLEHCSAWAGLHFFRSSPAADGHETPVISFAKGLGFLSERLASHFPEGSIRTATWAVQVENKPNEVWITAWNESAAQFYALKSRYVVVALPKNQVYHLVAGLAESGRDEFRGHMYSPWMVANVHLKHLPDYGEEGEIRWDNTIFDSWTMGYVNNSYTNEPNRSPEARHVWSLYACFPDDSVVERAKMIDKDWNYWRKLVVAELKLAHPEIESLIERLDVWLWGHPMRQPSVGSVWGPKREAMQQAFGRVHFSHVDTCGVPVVEEAIDQAMRLALHLSKLLKTDKA